MTLHKTTLINSFTYYVGLQLGLEAWTQASLLK